MLSPKGKDQIDCRKEKLVHKREVCKAMPYCPMIQDTEMIDYAEDDDEEIKDESPILINADEHPVSTLFCEKYKYLLSVLD